MQYLRIMDVRARCGELGLDLYIDGLGSGVRRPLAPSVVSAMLQVFNAGRPCYWHEGTNSFHTDPTMTDPAPIGTLTAGTISSWDVIIPEKGDATLVLNLLAETTFPTSGDQAVARAIMQVRQELLPSAIAILCARYVRYEDGSLQNTTIDAWP